MGWVGGDGGEIGEWGVGGSQSSDSYLCHILQQTPVRHGNLVFENDRMYFLQAICDISQGFKLYYTRH